MTCMARGENLPPRSGDAALRVRFGRMPSKLANSVDVALIQTGDVTPAVVATAVATTRAVTSLVDTMTTVGIAAAATMVAPDPTVPTAVFADSKATNSSIF
jgi:hypothetical protein